MMMIMSLEALQDTLIALSRSSHFYAFPWPSFIAFPTLLQNEILEAQICKLIHSGLPSGPP